MKNPLTPAQHRFLLALRDLEEPALHRKIMDLNANTRYTLQTRGIINTDNYPTDLGKQLIQNSHTQTISLSPAQHRILLIASKNNGSVNDQCDGFHLGAARALYNLDLMTRDHYDGTYTLNDNGRKTMKEHIEQSRPIGNDCENRYHCNTCDTLFTGHNP